MTEGTGRMWWPSRWGVGSRGDRGVVVVVVVVDEKIQRRFVGGREKVTVARSTERRTAVDLTADVNPGYVFNDGSTNRYNRDYPRNRVEI